MKKIAIFSHHPVCSDQSVFGIVQALSYSHLLERFTLSDDLNSVLNRSDCVVFPGGFGDADLYYTFFKRRHGNAVADFVKNGGKYVGICMGQYWAGSNYFDILDGIEVVQYITRPEAEKKRPFGTVAEITYDGHIHTDNMFFYDGGAAVIDESAKNYKIKARYKNGDPMALIQGNVGIIGCHPESEKYWYGMYPYIKEYWHEGQHHKWLLEFVNELWSVSSTE